MKRRDLVLGLAALAASPALAQRRRAVPAAPRDWSRTVTLLPDGAWLVGNPQAPHRLVEFLSYTCPHCAMFYADAAVPLARERIAPGSLAVEMRPAVRDALDLAAGLLARCGGAQAVQANTAAIFAAQEQWLAAGAAYQQANGARLQAMPIEDALVDAARNAGLTAVVTARGVAPAAAEACLRDAAARATLARLSNDAWRVRQIPGTPHFTLDGRALDHVHDWAGLNAQLPARP